MIGYLSGTVKFIFDDEIILNVGGVGYRISADTANLKVDAAAEFFIHTAVKEDSISLYGFKDREEFELFESLLTVSGVGAKSAMAILKKISPAEFISAVVSQDLKALTKLPGVGKKSAERILLELKDKFKNLPKNALVQGGFKSAVFDEATEALTALGYTSAEISSVLDKAPNNLTTEKLIAFALRELNRFV